MRTVPTPLPGTLPQTRVVTRAEFSANKKELFDLTETGVVVVVQDDHGNILFKMATPTLSDEEYAVIMGGIFR